MNILMMESASVSPFHENYQTPAAKMFKDKRGDTIFCFSEQKVYHPVDVIKRGMLSTPIEQVFRGLWSQLTDNVKERLVDLYGKPIDYIPQSWKDNKEVLEKFKLGEISFEQYLEVLRISLD